MHYTWIPATAVGYVGSATGGPVIYPAVAGAGPGVTTGPLLSINLDCAYFTGTAGQIADSGIPCTGVNPFVSPLSWTSGGTGTWTPPYGNGNLSLTSTPSTTYTLDVSGLTNGAWYTVLIAAGAGGSGTTLNLGTGCTWVIANSIDYAPGATSVTITSIANDYDVLAFTYDGTRCVGNFH
jgi:hypothetical protein